MNIQNLAAVPILLGFATFFAVRRRYWAETLYQYYNSRPDPKWRPHWLPWAFRPTHRQANVMSWVAIGFFLALAVVTGILSFA
jgi:hypothetical protein